MALLGLCVPAQRAECFFRTLRCRFAAAKSSRSRPGSPWTSRTAFIGGGTDEGLALVLRSELCVQLRRDIPSNVPPEGAVRVCTHSSPHALRGEHRVARAPRAPRSRRGELGRIDSSRRAAFRAHGRPHDDRSPTLRGSRVSRKRVGGSRRTPFHPLKLPV